MTGYRRALVVLCLALAALLFAFGMWFGITILPLPKPQIVPVYLPPANTPPPPSQTGAPA
jgi:hypothetical protein